MAQLIVTLPDNQVAFFKKVVAQMGYAAEKAAKKPEEKMPFDDMPDTDKAKALRKLLKEKKDLKPVMRDVLDGLAHIYEGKPMQSAEDFLKELKALDEAEEKSVAI